MRKHHPRDPAFTAMRRLLVLLVLGFVALGLTTTRADRPDQPTPPPGAPAAYSHEELQGDADMTQQMSTPNANTGAQSHLRDPQLGRARDANYLRLLEQHQADIDRMLARPGP